MCSATRQISPNNPSTCFQNAVRSKWVEVALIITAAVAITLGLLANFDFLQFNGSVPFFHAMCAVSGLLCLIALCKSVIQGCQKNTLPLRHRAQMSIVIPDSPNPSPQVLPRSPKTNLAAPPSIPVRKNAKAPTLADLQSNPELFESRPLSHEEIMTIFHSHTARMKKSSEAQRDKVYGFILGLMMNLKLQQNPYQIAKIALFSQDVDVRNSQTDELNWLLSEIWKILQKNQ